MRRVVPLFGEAATAGGEGRGEARVNDEREGAIHVIVGISD